MIFKKIKEIANITSKFFTEVPNAKQTKTGLVLESVILKIIQEPVDSYNRDVAKLEYDHVTKYKIKHALEDKETGSIMFNEKGDYLFDKEGFTKVKEAQMNFHTNILPQFDKEYDQKDFDLPHAPAEPFDLKELSPYEKTTILDFLKELNTK